MSARGFEVGDAFTTCFDAEGGAASGLAGDAAGLAGDGAGFAAATARALPLAAALGAVVLVGSAAISLGVLGAAATGALGTTSTLGAVARS